LDKPSAVDVTAAFDAADERMMKGKDYDVPGQRVRRPSCGQHGSGNHHQYPEDQEPEPDETFVITMGVVTNATKVALNHDIVIDHMRRLTSKGSPEVDRGVDEDTGQTTVRF
jgi:hypothetical protein